MTLLGNYLEDHLKVLAYSTSRARTAGDGLEGDLVHISYELVEGAELPSEVTFFLGLANLPGTSMDPELLNVVCGYPGEDSPVVVETNALALDENLTIPTEFALHQNYPNPFNPETKIKFATERFSDVTVTIYSILGEEVSVAHNGQLAAGTYDITWYGKDSQGNKVPSGVYFYEVRSDDRIQKGKMLLLK